MCDLPSFFSTSICHFGESRKCTIKRVYLIVLRKRPGNGSHRFCSQAHGRHLILRDRLVARETSSLGGHVLSISLSLWKDGENGQRDNQRSGIKTHSQSPGVRSPGSQTNSQNTGCFLHLASCRLKNNSWSVMLWHRRVIFRNDQGTCSPHPQGFLRI